MVTAFRIPEGESQAIACTADEHEQSMQAQCLPDNQALCQNLKQADVGPLKGMVHAAACVVEALLGSDYFCSIDLPVSYCQ